MNPIRKNKPWGWYAVCPDCSDVLPPRGLNKNGWAYWNRVTRKGAKDKLHAHRKKVHA